MPKSHTYIVDYLWLDGYEPQNIRSKIKVITSTDPWPIDLPYWSFDGSSTKQAEGNNSDCILSPVSVRHSQNNPNYIMAMCEVYNSDGTPHETNYRSALDNSLDYWFGFEQEYVIHNPVTQLPVGFPEKGYPRPQGEYYCGVGHHIISGRDIAMEHMHMCLDYGIGITGINAEVLLGQWEYQVFGKGAATASDDLWMSRYLLHHVCERHNLVASIHPKPVDGDWNGSGMHINFSNSKIRSPKSDSYIEKVLGVFEQNHMKHISVYGVDNDKRLTGNHETSPIHEFTYGKSNRGASIRIPVFNNDAKKYLEDRRPAANADPYRATHAIVTSLKEVDVQ